MASSRYRAAVNGRSTPLGPERDRRWGDNDTVLEMVDRAGNYIVNGDTVLARSGSTGWEQHSYDLKPGANSLSWTYTKDSSDTDGDDAAYLDEVTFSGYAGWTAIHGITTAGGFFMDAEGDGVANGLEYATGISPLLFDSHMLPRPYMNNSQLLKLSFTKPLDVSGITYDAEVSDDLENWNTTGRSILINSSSQDHPQDITISQKDSLARPSNRLSMRSLMTTLSSLTAGLTNS